MNIRPKRVAARNLRVQRRGFHNCGRALRQRTGTPLSARSDLTFDDAHRVQARPPPAFDSSDVRASRARLLQALDVFADEISRDSVDELDAPLNVDAAPTRTPVARCCCCLGWLLFPKPAPPSPAEVELPEWRPRKPKYAKVATTPSAGGFAIAADGSDSD